MDEVRHIFIINPAAGSKNRSMEVASAIRARMSAKNAAYESYITEYPTHATEIVRKVAAAHPGESLRFYACGGDGTLNEVATGVARLSGVPFTHIPTGTGNDFIKMFGESIARFSDIGDITGGEIVPIDAIESDGGLSINVLNIGIDARVARSMQKYKRLPITLGSMSYTVAAVEHIIRGIGRPYAVTVDGVSYDGAYTLIAVANGRYYGGGFLAVPEADCADGYLNVLLVKAVSRLKAAWVLGEYKAGRYRNYPDVCTCIKAKSLSVYSQNGVPMEICFDGEVKMAGRIEARLSPEPLQFIVPRGVRQVPPPPTM